MQIKNYIAALVIILFTWYIMLFFGSFLLDVPILLIIGFIIALVSLKLLPKLIHPRKSLIFLFVATLVIFYFASVSLYFNMPYVDFIHESAAERYPFMSESPSGFHFMINSGILNIDYVEHEDAPLALHLFSVVFFISYILWTYLGVRLGRLLFEKK